MTIDEAARKLREMYLDPTTDKAVSIHLFGIRYADQLEGRSLKEVAARAEVPVTYATKIRKGINLAAYVRER